MKTIFILLGALLLTTSVVCAQDNTDRQRKASADQPIIISAAHVGSSPFNPPTVTDSNFVVDTGTGLDSGCTFRNGGPLRITLSVDRVVGDVNSDGTLIDPQTLISNGVVSKYATLQLPAYDVDYDASLSPPYQPERDHILVNGKEVGPSGSVAYLTGADSVWKLNEFRIPIEFLRFGRRNVGGTPTAGQNLIEIQIDVANIANGNELWCTAIDWVSLKFEALAPVIMVHGNGSSGEFFKTFNFIKAFQDQKIPFDNDIQLATASIATNGSDLATKIPNKAKEFGARHVHIVAHSKGGLDTRDFLARTIPSNFGVLSLTTLSTPHHGSAGADYILDSQDANAFFSDNPARVAISNSFAVDEGRKNLRVSVVEAFNQQNSPLLPRQITVDGETSPLVYSSVSADANLDDSTFLGSPTIQFNETAGVVRNGAAMTIAYVLLGTVASTELKPVNILGRTVWVVKETPTSTFQLNDFLVTVNSARFPGFTEILSTKANHATIGSLSVGNQVIKAIRSAQPVK